VTLTRRELVLGWLAGVVILYGATYWFGASYVQEWKDIRAQRGTLAKQIEVAEHWLAQQSKWQAQLEQLEAKLPHHKTKENARQIFMTRLEKLRQKHALEVQRRKQVQETSKGNLYELSVWWQWQGTLDSIVRFLYDLQAGGDLMDATKIAITSMRDPGKLKGTLTVSYAYSRGKPPDKEAAP